MIPGHWQMLSKPAFQLPYHVDAWVEVLHLQVVFNQAINVAGYPLSAVLSMKQVLWVGEWMNLIQYTDLYYFVMPKNQCFSCGYAGSLYPRIFAWLRDILWPVASFSIRSWRWFSENIYCKCLRCTGPSCKKIQSKFSACFMLTKCC